MDEKETKSDTAADWLDARIADLDEKLSVLCALRRALTDCGEWSEVDAQLIWTVIYEMEDYREALKREPELSARLDETILQGPALILPEQYTAFICNFGARLDGYLYLASGLWTMRLALHRLDATGEVPEHSPRAAAAMAQRETELRERRKQCPLFPFAQIDHGSGHLATTGSGSLVLNVSCENRRSNREYITAMQARVEGAIVAAGLGLPRPSFNHYRLERMVLEITGAARLRFSHYARDISEWDMLSAAEVNGPAPLALKLQPLDLTAERPDFSGVAQRNGAALDAFVTASEIGWRKLTDIEKYQAMRRLAGLA